jgi:dihydroxyacetone kinase-like protein
MLEGASVEVIANERTLTELDSVAGDGDHGTTMCRAAHSILKLAEEGAPDISTLFARTGDLFLSNDGGASGGLLGAFFLNAALPCEDKRDLDSRDLAAAFESGLLALRRYTKAKLGDKTLLDALEPAVVMLRESAFDSEPVDLALESAAKAATRGALETKNMKATFGRAQYLGERTIGWQDPGATTIACVFTGFVNGLKRLEGTTSNG